MANHGGHRHLKQHWPSQGGTFRSPLRLTTPKELSKWKADSRHGQVRTRSQSGPLPPGLETQRSQPVWAETDARGISCTAGSLGRSLRTESQRSPPSLLLSRSPSRVTPWRRTLDAPEHFARPNQAVLGETGRPELTSRGPLRAELTDGKGNTSSGSPGLPVPPKWGGKCTTIQNSETEAM